MEFEGFDELLEPALWGERLSALVDPRPVIVHAHGESAAPEVLDVLRHLPAVTVLTSEAPLADPAVAGAFDICLTGAPEPPSPWVPASTDGVSAAVAAQPLATLAAVTNLRATEGADTWTGLLTESAAYAALLGGGPFHAWLARRGPPRTRSSGPAVTVERRDDQLHITLDRPDVHNAFNTAMRDGLVEALQLAAADRSVAAIHLRGNGPSFCSGGDLDEFGSVLDPAIAHAVRLTRHAGWWMDACRDRLTAHVHGAAVGAGIELAAFAARIVAAPDAYFALPEVGMGLLPGAGGTVSIPRRIGRQRTAWMAVTGQRVDAESARAWGLIDSIE